MYSSRRLPEGNDIPPHILGVTKVDARRRGDVAVDLAVRPCLLQKLGGINSNSEPGHTYAHKIGRKIAEKYKLT